MSDTASLIIRVQSDGVSVATKRLGDMARATDKLMSAWKGMAALTAGYFGLQGATDVLKRFLETSKEFESINARLKTVTGSTENAKQAFQALFDFALKTPFTLKEVSNAFIQMTSYGLEPSEKALRAFGDTASSMGQGLTDMVRAVARAISGEFEPLRTFGVQARKEGDEISLTFRGVTQRMKNDAKSIQTYFENLGETFFKDAMLERMKTLEGKLSNMEDAWDRLFFTISNAGVGDVIKQSVDVATNALNELSERIESGQLGMELDAWAAKWAPIGQAAKDAWGAVVTATETGLDSIGTSWNEIFGWIWDAIKNFPENVKMLMDGIGAFVGGAFEYTKGMIGLTWDIAKATFTNLKEMALGYFDMLKAGVTLNFDAWKAGRDRLDAAFVSQIMSLKEVGNAQIELRDKVISAVQETISASLDERDASQSNFKAQIEGAAALREAYEQLAERRRQIFKGIDRLAQFGTGSGGTAATAGFDNMVLAMQTEYQRIEDVYKKRKELIIVNTRGTEELLAEASDRYAKTLTVKKKDMEVLLAEQEITFVQELNLLNKQNFATDAARQAAIDAASRRNDEKVSLIRKTGADTLAAMDEAYQKEREFIIKQNVDNAALREKLLADAQRKYEADKFAYDWKKKRELQDFGEGPSLTGNDDIDKHNAERQQLEDEYAWKTARLKQFLADKEISEEEHAARLARINNDYAVKSRILEQSSFQARLGMASDFFGNLATISSVFGKKGFKVMKALSIASAIIDTYKAANAAIASMAGTGPFGVAMGAVQAAAAIAMGMKNVMMIRSQEYSGAYAHGGLIPSGKFGLVGETGQPELVKGPAMVTSASRTAELMGRNGAAPMQVNIANYGGGEVTAKERVTPDGKVLDILIRKIETTMANAISTGGTPIARAMETAYGVNRANQR